MSPNQPAADLSPLDRLTPRERQVLELTATGVTNQVTARLLCITVHAVKFHLAHVYQKLGVENRVQASMVLYSNAPGHNGDADLNGAIH
jgi:DNA-binding CsgD family transcriptional regulator